MKIAIVTVQVPFVRGGSEVLAEAFCRALREAGHEAEILALPFAPATTDALLDSLASFRLIELSSDYDRVVALKFPAYLVRHPHKILWLIHQHHGAYERFFGDFGLANLPDGRLAREAVRAADRQAFAEARSIFTISRTVASRLEFSHGVTAPVLYPPPRQAQSSDSAPVAPVAPAAPAYLFFPSRLAPDKRQSLALRALTLTREPVRLVFAGVPDRSPYGAELEALAAELGVAERVEWRGFVAEEELAALYAGCRAVLFPPRDEDYGYISIEAMLAGKAVITCSDSGGALEFVQGGADATGWVAAPEPAALAAVCDAAWSSPEECARRGAAARAEVAGRVGDWKAALATLFGNAT